MLQGADAPWSTAALCPVRIQTCETAVTPRVPHAAWELVLSVHWICIRTKHNSLKPLHLYNVEAYHASSIQSESSQPIYPGPILMFTVHLGLGLSSAHFQNGVRISYCSWINNKKLCALKSYTHFSWQLQLALRMLSASKWPSWAISLPSSTRSLIFWSHWLMSVSSTCRYCCTNSRGLQAKPKPKPTSKSQLILKYYKDPSPIQGLNTLCT